MDVGWSCPSAWPCCSGVFWGEFPGSLGLGHLCVTLEQLLSEAPLLCTEMNFLGCKHPKISQTCCIRGKTFIQAAHFSWHGVKTRAQTCQNLERWNRGAQGREMTARRRNTTGVTTSTSVPVTSHQGDITRPQCQHHPCHKPLSKILSAFRRSEFHCGTS